MLKDPFNVTRKLVENVFGKMSAEVVLVYALNKYSTTNLYSIFKLFIVIVTLKCQVRVLRVQSNRKQTNFINKSFCKIYKIIKAN